jgi:hypothetical protein
MCCKQPLELRQFVDYKAAHHFHSLARLLCRQPAKPLFCNGHQLFGIHVPDHVYRRVLPRCVPIVFVLPVVALAADKRLCVDVAG